MKNLVIVAHIPSKNTLHLAQDLEVGAQRVNGLKVSRYAPGQTSSEELLNADGVIFFTTENFGYMSGALKDLFDRCYYDLIDSKRGMPYALLIRAGKDGTGAKRSCESILQGLGWRKVQEAIILKGDFSEDFLLQAQELGETFAYALAEGII